MSANFDWYDDNNFPDMTLEEFDAEMDKIRHQKWAANRALTMIEMLRALELRASHVGRKTFIYINDDGDLAVIHDKPVGAEIIGSWEDVGYVLQHVTLKEIRDAEKARILEASNE